MIKFTGAKSGILSEMMLLGWMRILWSFHLTLRNVVVVQQRGKSLTADFQCFKWESFPILMFLLLFFYHWLYLLFLLIVGEVSAGRLRLLPPCLLWESANASNRWVLSNEVNMMQWPPMSPQVWQCTDLHVVSYIMGVLRNLHAECPWLCICKISPVVLHTGSCCLRVASVIVKFVVAQIQGMN